MGARVRLSWVPRIERTGKVPRHEEASREVVLDGIAGRSTAGGNSQLAVDRAHMEIDGDDADDQPLSNLRAGQALSKQTEHIQLTRGKPGVKRRSKRRRWGRRGGRHRSGRWHGFKVGQDLFQR